MIKMATIKGVNQTLIDAGVGLSSQIAAGLIDGRVKVIHDYYVLAGTEAAGTVIEFGGDLVSGSKILQVVLSASAAQTSLTCQVGTSYNADEFVATGNTALQTAVTPLIAYGKAYVVGTATADSQITVTTEAATATAATLYCTIYYSTN